MSKVQVRTIKESDTLTKINLTPIGNWMITTAFIEPEESDLFVGKQYRPTFMNMQRVLSMGPNADSENIKLGDWIYIDMARFMKTVKKENTPIVGVGGQPTTEERLVPPIFTAPGDDRAYFKISDREIEGVIKDPYKMKKKYSTVEDFLKYQEKIMKEVSVLKKAADMEVVHDVVESKAPAIHGANSGGRTKK